MLKFGPSDNPSDVAHAGEVTQLMATVTGEPSPKTIDPKAHFIVSGGTLTKPVLVDVVQHEKLTGYIASYTFPVAGTYKAHFFARPDGFPVQDEGEVRVVAHSAPTAWPKTPNPGVWPTVKPGPKSSAPPTGTITLTPDPVPFSLPGAPGAPPPPPLPSLP
ncbi:MAG: hypothetical protein NVSMB1_26800 [Polyangiales bacterium]